MQKTFMRGVFPILVTPFDEQSRIDEDSLRSQVEFNLAAGVHGLGVALGSEVFKLSEAEREQVTRMRGRPGEGAGAGGDQYRRERRRAGGGVQPGSRSQRRGRPDGYAPGLHARRSARCAGLFPGDLRGSGDADLHPGHLLRAGFPRPGAPDR